MLNDKICKLREKLDESIRKDLDYSIIYQLSIELDELIAQYYMETKNTKNSRKMLKNSWQLKKHSIQ